jgi:N-acetylated-alpha-linked acidic dipeptidase
MDTFGDPGWFHHQQIAQLWGLAALRLATTPVVGFSATTYTDKMKSYLDSLQSAVSDITDGDMETANALVDLQPLENALEILVAYAKRLDSKAREIRRNPRRQRCYLKFFCVSHTRSAEIERVNKAYIDFERGVVGKGLPRRPIYKHVVYAPGTWEGYAGLTFPGIREAIMERRWEEAHDQIHEVAELLWKIASNGKF